MALSRSRMDFTRMPTRASQHKQLQIADSKRDGLFGKQQCTAAKSYTGYVTAKDNKICENILIDSLKSHYCWEEMNKASNCKRTWKPSNTTISRQDSASAQATCDAVFLRKLLALNKKQEMELNKKLATVLREEEYRKPSEGKFERNRNGEFRIPVETYGIDDRRNAFVNEKRYVYERLPPEPGDMRRPFSASRKKARASSLKVQYDLNGRRIYYYSDVEEDELEEADIKPALNYPPRKTETWINTTTVIKTNSDVTCGFMGKGKVSSQRQSMTVVDQPGSRDIRCQGDGADSKGANKFFVKPYVPRDPGSSRGVRGSRSSQVVQSAVAHCYEVAPERLDSARKKRVFKVWDYNNIQKANQPNVLGDKSKQVDRYQKGSGLNRPPGPVHRRVWP